MDKYGAHPSVVTVSIRYYQRFIPEVGTQYRIRVPRKADAIIVANWYPEINNRI